MSANSILRKKIATRTLMGIAAIAAVLLWLQIPIGPVATFGRQSAQNGSEKSSIRVNVELVNAPVVVRNAKGEYVLDLSLNNFRVFDNGIEQNLAGMEVGGAPISAAIVIESSSRILGLLPLLRPTGILFTNTILGETGEAAVFGYNDTVDELIDFTTDHDAIEKAVSNIQTSTSGACLYDALSQAANALRNRDTSRRKVIITLGESTDTNCEVKLGEVLPQLQNENIAVYAVGLSWTAAEWHGPETQYVPPPATPRGTFGLNAFPGTAQTPWGMQQYAGNMNLNPFASWALWGLKHATGTARDPLKITAAMTGGFYQDSFDNDTIEIAIDHIAAELSSQYTLSYDLTRSVKGGYHKIKVEVVGRPDLMARSRPGYYLGPL
ncbi:MAG TPA: VWA domain-containing protein [Candidatus Acidoferrales bacterium]|jgi:VWFA-related protein